jgi:hypothetical protein
MFIETTPHSPPNDGFVEQRFDFIEFYTAQFVIDVSR